MPFDPFKEGLATPVGVAPDGQFVSGGKQVSLPPLPDPASLPQPIPVATPPAVSDEPSPDQFVTGSTVKPSPAPVPQESKKTDEPFDPFKEGLATPLPFDPFKSGLASVADDSSFTDEGAPKYGVVDAGTPYERTALTKEGYLEDKKKRTWGDVASDTVSGTKEFIKHGLTSLGKIINTTGLDALSTSGEMAEYNRFTKNPDGTFVRDPNGDYKPDPSIPNSYDAVKEGKFIPIAQRDELTGKQTIGTPVEALTTIPKMGKDIVSGIYRGSEKVGNRIFYPSDQAKNLNEESDYQNYLANHKEAFAQNLGESNIGSMLETLGFDKNDVNKYVDVGVANDLGLVLTPEFLAGKAGMAVKSLAAEGRFGEAVKIMTQAAEAKKVANALKAAEEAKTAEAIKPPEIPTPTSRMAPIAAATEDVAKAAETAPLQGEEAILGEVKPPELKTEPVPEVPAQPAPKKLVEAAPETNVPKEVSAESPAPTPSKSVEFIEKAATSPEQAGRIQRSAEWIARQAGRTKDFGALALKSPATAAIVTAGNALEKTGAGAQWITSFIAKHPFASAFAIPVGENLIQGEDFPDAIYDGALSSAKYFIGIKGLHTPTLKMMEGLSEVGQVASTTGKALSLGLTDSRGMGAMAARLPEGSLAKTLFRMGEVGPKALEDITGKVPPAWQQLAVRTMKGGFYLIPEIIDPATRGAMIASGLSYAQSGGDIDSAIQNTGPGAILGLGGHVTGTVLGGKANQSQLAYIGMRLKELSPELQSSLLQMIQSGKLDTGTLAANLEIHDLLKPSGGQVHFLGADEFGKVTSDLANKGVTNPQQMVTPETAANARGYIAGKNANGKSGKYFIDRDADGKAHLYINKDSADSSTLPHEAFHLFESIGRFADFGKNGPTGPDLLEPGKAAFYDALTQKYSDADLADFYQQYERRLGHEVPLDPKTGKAVLTPNEKGKIVSELFADAGGQFLERTSLHSNGEGMAEYSKMINSMDSGAVDQIVKSIKPTAAGVRAPGESALFVDASGSKIRNTPEMEKAIADFVLRMKGAPGTVAAPEEGVSKIKVPESELISKVNNAVTTIRQARYSNNVPAIDAANKEIIDLIKTNIYKTRPKPPAQITAEAKERAERIYGKGNVTQTEIDLSKPYIPVADIVNDRNLPMQPGDKPQFLSNAERNKLESNLISNIFSALEGKGAPSEGDGLMKTVAKDGKVRYEGSHITDDQMQQLERVDPNSLPRGLLNVMKVVSDAIKKKTGQVFSGVYFEGIEKKGNIRKSYRAFAPTSIMISKEGNAAMTAFDVGKFNKDIEALGDKNPNSPYLKPFEEPEHTTPEQAVDEFKRGVIQYNQNHAEGKPGETNLDPDPQRALAKKNAINGFFGIVKGDVNPLASDKNYYRTFRFDRIYNLKGTDSAPFTIPYNEKTGERLQESNFQPGQDNGVNSSVDNNEKNVNFKSNEFTGRQEADLRGNVGNNQLARESAEGSDKGRAQSPLEAARQSFGSGEQRELNPKEKKANFLADMSEQKPWVVDEANTRDPGKNYKTLEDVSNGNEELYAKLTDEWRKKFPRKLPNGTEFFQPKGDDLTALRLDEDRLSTRVLKYNDIEREGPKSIFDYKLNQKRPETNEEYQQRLKFETGFHTPEEADEAARQAIDLRKQIRGLSGGSSGGGQTPPVAPETPPTGSFQPSGEAPMFYSKAEEAVDKLPEKFTVGQLRAALSPEKGVKPEELQWMKFESLLDGKSPEDKLTKAEAKDWAQESKVQVKEVVKGENGKGDPYKEYNKYAESLIEKYGEGKYNLNVIINELKSLTPEEKSKLDSLAKNVSDDRGAGTKFEQYQLPGGENYRELLFTLPEQGKKEPDGFVVYDKDGQPVSHVSSEEVAKQRASEKPGRTYKPEVQPSKKDNFTSTHFSEPNILAHVRFNERTDAQGKKVLFIEEVQSDWHQKGRKEGYNNKRLSQEEIRLAEKKVDELNAKMSTLARMKDQLKTDEEKKNYREQYDGLMAEKMSLVEKIQDRSGVPDAPFKKTWHELAMKRMLDWAVKNGFDKIAWTTGEQQAARYDLSKQISSIGYSGSNLEAFDHNGKTVIKQTGVSEAQLPDIIGKEAAEKLLKAPKQGTLRMIEGEDLKVGGEGMKGFYDKILPDFMNKYGKKFGAKVEPSEIMVGANEKAYRAAERSGDSEAIGRSMGGKELVHSLSITPQLKETVLGKGQAMFQPAGSEEITYPTEAAVGNVKPWLKAALANPDNQLVLHDITRDISQVLQDHKRAIEDATGLKLGISSNFQNGYQDKDSSPIIPVTINSKDIVGPDGRIIDSAHNAISKVGALLGKSLYQDAMGYTHSVKDGKGDNAVYVNTASPLNSNQMRMLGSYMDDHVGPKNHALIQDSSGNLRVLNTSIYSDSPIPLKDFIGQLDKGMQELAIKDAKLQVFENDGRLIEDKDYEKTLQTNSQSKPANPSSINGQGEGSGPLQGQDLQGEGGQGGGGGRVPLHGERKGYPSASGESSNIQRASAALSRDADRVYRSYQTQLNGGAFQPTGDTGGTLREGKEELSVRSKPLPWDSFRDLFSDKIKTKQNELKLENLWKQYNVGDLTLNEVLNEILKFTVGTPKKPQGNQDDSTQESSDKRDSKGSESSRGTQEGSQASQGRLSSLKVPSVKKTLKLSPV